MVVIKAPEIGFCKGGRDSIEGVKRLVEKGHKVYVYGYLLHNLRVISKLKRLGVIFLKPDPSVKVKGKLVIRAHGVSERVMKRLSDNNDVVDFTCPFVYKIHALTNYYERTGYHIIYLGKKGHPEAEGTLEGLRNYTLISSLDEGKQVKGKKLVFIAQSTVSLHMFEEIASYLRHERNALIVNTVCESTRERQVGTKELAKEVQLMILIGGKQSSNTHELFEISQQLTRTVWVEEPNEIMGFADLIKGVEKVGLTAGASTPDDDIEELYNLLTGLNQKV